MTPEQLEAHRARFEQRFYEINGFEPARLNASYIERLASIGWEAYQWALADVDPAQRAEQPPQQSAQPGGEAVKLVDALLLEAEIFWWNDGPEGKSSDAMKAARDQVIVALSAAAQPVEVQRVPMTIKQMHALSAKLHDMDEPLDEAEEGWTEVMALVAAIEAHHGIKPTSSEGGAS